MRNKFKKLINLIFLVLFLNDICRYIKIFITNKELYLLDFGFFSSKVSANYAILNYSTVFLCVIVFIYFISHYFRNNENQN